jgi:thiol-disulfide isomerase/thioredoxin
MSLFDSIDQWSHLMTRLLCLFVVGLLITPATWAEDPAPPEAAAAEQAKQAEDTQPQSIAERLKADPNSVALINEYMSDSLRRIMPMISTKPEEAEKQLNEMAALLGSLEPDADQAKQLLQRAVDFVASYKQRLEIARVSVQDLEAKLKENANDAKTISTYIAKVQQEAGSLLGSAPQQAEQMVKDAKQMLADVRERAESEEAKRAAETAQRAFDRLETSIAMQLITLDELAAKLKEDANDAKTISTYIAKVQQEASPLARSEPERADQLLKDAKQLLADVRERAESEEAKQAAGNADQAFARLESSIATGLRMAQLIGAEAAPLDVEGWVNGTPVSDQDLKGKVVLLDFWAIWCGPCVSTFPHLIEWHQKYADQGLVMVGLTRYYSYKWDPEAGQAVRSQEEVTHEQEQEAMAKYAESKGLLHRIAFQKDDDRTLSEYYAVTGIPHVVVIDREGKVRLIRVGSGEKNAQDIEAMIQKLIAEGGAT